MSVGCVTDSVEVYTASDAAPAGQRRIFLTQIIDPLGQAVTLTWDAQFKLVAIADAIGQVTTIAYEDPANPLRITKVTDPFGRHATFTYNAAGQLASITDVLGLTSRLDYGPEDFITALTTPYGVTSFRHEGNDNYVNRFVQATDPLGGTERVEYAYETPSLPDAVAANEVPTGFTAANVSLDSYNSFSWTKLAWSMAPGDLASATTTKWVVSPDTPGGAAFSTGVPHSVKKPLESRVWYLYPDQYTPAYAGSFSQPTRTGRIMDDGASQIYQATYNTQGSVLTKTDPLDRQTTYSYGTNGIDLLDVRQTTGGINDLLGTLHELHARSARRKASATRPVRPPRLTYNAAGQVLSITNPKSETTTLTYD